MNGSTPMKQNRVNERVYPLLTGHKVNHINYNCLKTHSTFKSETETISTSNTSNQKNRQQLYGCVATATH